MHFDSVSECQPATAITVTATNTSLTLSKQVYLPDFSNFVSVSVTSVIGSVVTVVTSTPFTVLPGETVDIVVIASSTPVSTVFYQYAVEELATPTANYYGGYFAITTASPNRTMKVLASERNKKWYNYDATTHNFYFYRTSTSTSSALPTAVSPASALIVPIHVVIDPNSQTTYMFEANTGSPLYPFKNNIGYRPFAYKKYVNDKFYEFEDLTAKIIANGKALPVSSTLTASSTDVEVVFNGTNSYLQVPSSIVTPINLALASFSFECWVYPTNLPALPDTLILNTPVTSFGSLTILFDGAAFIFGFSKAKVFAIVAGNAIGLAAHTLSTNTWTHLAVVRKNSSLLIFINGMEVFSNYFSPSTAVSLSSITMGKKIGPTIGPTAIGFFKGSITNLLLTKDNLYSATYTVPTTTYSSSTTGNIFQLSVNPSGSTFSAIESITSLNFNELKTSSLIVPPSSYVPTRAMEGRQPFAVLSPKGTSVVFRGTSALEVNTGLPTTSPTATIGTGDFTIEAWIYLTDLLFTEQSFLGSWNSKAVASGDGPDGLIFNIRLVPPAFAGATTFADIKFNHYEYFSDSYSRRTSLNGTIVVTSGGIYQWYHVAVVRSGPRSLTTNNVNLYVNGGFVTSGKSDPGSSVAINGSLTQTTWRIGDHNPTYFSPTMSTFRPRPFTGAVTNVRISKSALYSGSSFTLPAGPLTASADTVFLLNVKPQTLFFDTTSNNVVDQIDVNSTNSGVVKFATNSGYLNKSGLEVITKTLAASLKTALNSSTAVTIEWWMNLPSSFASPSRLFMLGGKPYGTGTPRFYFSLIQSGTNWYFEFRQNFTASSTPVVHQTAPVALGTIANQWLHCSVIKIGSELRFYLNGDLKIVGNFVLTFSSDIDSFYIGGNGITDYFEGYIEDFIIKVGTNNQIPGTFTPTKTLSSTPSSGTLLAYDFKKYKKIPPPAGSVIDNSVFLLSVATPGVTPPAVPGTIILDKIDVNLTITGSGLPATTAPKNKSNWIISGGLSFEEDVPFSGSFLAYATSKYQATLSPGALCVESYEGRVFVGGIGNIRAFDAGTLAPDPAYTITGLPFTVVSLKAYFGGFIATSVDHRIYKVPFTASSGLGPVTILYSSVVLGLPDGTDTKLYVPEPEQSQLVVVDLVNPTTPLTFISLDSQFAPSFVAIDQEKDQIYVCGHDSDLVYYKPLLTGTTFTSIQFDNKVAWLSACEGTLVVSYYLIDETIIDVATLTRPARIYQDTRTALLGTLIGTRPHRVKMIGRHSGVPVTVPGYSTTQLIAGTVPSWITDFQSSKIYVWNSGVRDQFIAAHNNYVSATYQSADKNSISVRVPYVMGDRAAHYDINVISSPTTYPKNLFPTKTAEPAAHAPDANTLILMHFDDPVGYSLFTDDATIPPRVYTGGTTKTVISTAQAKFQGRSGFFLSSSYITIPSPSNLGFGATVTDFAVEMWVYPNPVPVGTVIAPNLLSPGSPLTAGQWEISINSDSAVVWTAQNATTKFSIVSNKSVVPASQWTHIAINRLGGVIIIYANGNPEGFANDITDYTPAGTVAYTLGKFSGFIDELRVSNISRYSGKFLPGTPIINLTTPVQKPKSTTYVAQFDEILSLGAPPPLAPPLPSARPSLEYGLLRVNGLIYDGTVPVNDLDRITVEIILNNSAETSTAPILTIGEKQFALPVNSNIQTLTEYTIEVKGLPTHSLEDFLGFTDPVGGITPLEIVTSGRYYVPNYLPNYVKFIKINGIPVNPGTYVTLTAKDDITVEQWLTSSRMNDTVDVFLVGASNVQLTLETIKTATPKFMNFGYLTTINALSANMQVGYGFTDVGLITDPFTGLVYLSYPVTVTGIPAAAPGIATLIDLTTDQTIIDPATGVMYGPYLIKTDASGVITQTDPTTGILKNVTNGDKIQIVKKVHNYFETGVNLQVVYIDTTGIIDYVDVGQWSVVPMTFNYTPPGPYGSTGSWLDYIGIEIGTVAMNNFNVDNASVNYGLTQTQDWDKISATESHLVHNDRKFLSNQSASKITDYRYEMQKSFASGVVNKVLNYSEFVYAGNVAKTTNAAKFNFMPNYEYGFDRLGFRFTPSREYGLFKMWTPEFKLSNEYGLFKMWTPEFKLSNEYGLSKMWTTAFNAFKLSNEYGLFKMWTPEFKLSNEYGLSKMWTPAFKLSNEYGLPKMWKSTFQQSREYGLPNMWKSTFQQSREYGLPKMWKSTFQLSHEYGLPKMWKSTFQQSREYGLPKMWKSTFQQSHEYGLPNMWKSTFQQSHEYGLPNMWKSTFQQSHEYGLPKMWKSTFQQSREYGLPNMWKSTFQQSREYGLPNMWKSTFQQSREYGLPKMWALTLQQSREYGLPNMWKSTFQQSREYGLPNMWKSTFQQSREYGLPNMWKSTFQQSHEYGIHDMWKSTFLPSSYIINDMWKSTFLPSSYIINDMWKSTFLPSPTYLDYAQIFVKSIGATTLFDIRPPEKQLYATTINIPVEYIHDLPELNLITLKPDFHYVNIGLIVGPEYVHDLPELNLITLKPDFHYVNIGLIVGPEYVHDLPMLTMISPEYHKHLVNYGLVIGPEYVHDLPMLTMISPEYHKHLVNYGLVIGPEYQHLLNTEIIIVPEYHKHLVNYGLVIGPEYVHDLPMLTMISPEYHKRLVNYGLVIGPEYQHLLNTEIIIVPEYQHLLNTEIIIVPEYQHLLNTEIIIVPEYQHLLNTEIIIVPEYQHLLNTEINISTEYRHLLNTEIIIVPEYQHLLNTEIIIVPEYQHLLNTEIDIRPKYEHLFNTEIDIRPKYEHLFNTEIDIRPKYEHLFNTEIDIRPKYEHLFNTEIDIRPKYEHLFNTEIDIRPKYEHLFNTEINIMSHYVNIHPTEILIDFLAKKDISTTILYDAKYEIHRDILWDLNDDLSRFGGFPTIGDAEDDANSKNYINYTIREIISDNGVVYYTYRVNQNNDFVCGILAPKRPRYGLIRGG